MDIPKLGESSRSAITAPQRKPRGPHPSRKSGGKAVTKLPPPLPASSSEPARPAANAKGVPTLPLKVLQGAGTRRTDSSKPGYGREVVFVTRKTGLGALLGRSKSLVMDEGYTRLRIHALSAAIPQAMMLLHALLDVLPYPRGPRGLWYELRTDSVECTDEIDGEGGIAGNSFEQAIANLGAVEAPETRRVKKLKSSIQIDLYIGPKAGPLISDTKRPRQSAPGEGKSRLNKKRREALRAKHTEGEKAGDGAEHEMGEEEMMNMMDMVNADVGQRVSSQKSGAGRAAPSGTQYSEAEEEIEG